MGDGSVSHIFCLLPYNVVTRPVASRAVAAMLLTAGLGLFLFGMQMMSGSLEAAAQGRMEGWLRRLTGNRILGVLTGAAVTALVQSSTAITVLAVGLVDRGILSLTQAVWIIWPRSLPPSAWR